MIENYYKLEDLIEHKQCNNLKLFYVEHIHTQYLDYDERAKKEFLKQESERGYMNRMLFDNPEYVEGEREYYAYFTENEFCELHKSEFDDEFDNYYSDEEDLYDTDFVSAMNNSEIFKFYRCGFTVKSYDIFLPCEWGDKCFFTPMDINAGVMPWIFDNKDNYNDRIAIYAATNPYTMKEQLERIDKNTIKNKVTM